MSTRQSPDSSGKKPLALIAGPTASGKTHIAIQLALALKNRGQAAAVVNCDSAQVYYDLATLSARPTDDEMYGVPHHLFGFWDGSSACSTADWAQAAKDIILRLHQEDVRPILVGGTGFYIRTLLDGISPIPAIDAEIRATVRAMPQSDARAALEAEDAEAAARLAPGDTARTARALEVVRSTGRPLWQWHGHLTGGIGPTVDLHPLILVPDREDLYHRCNIRFEAMLEEGAITEVETLAARNINPELPVMRAIGVREIMAWLKGEISRDEMIARGQLSTRQYAKRQYTWFRNQTPSGWMRLPPENFNLYKNFELLLQH